MGRAIAQGVSPRLPTALARVRSQVRSRGVYGRQSDTGAGFLRVLRFPLSILISPPALDSLIIESSTLCSLTLTASLNKQQKRA
jgi:hypothetical protein